MQTPERRPGKRSGRWIAAGALAGLAVAGVVLGLALSGESPPPGEQAPQSPEAPLTEASATSGEPTDRSPGSLPSTAEIEVPATAEPIEQPPEPPATVESADERRDGGGEEEEEEEEEHTVSTQPAPAAQEPPGPPRIGESPDDPTSATTATFSFVAPAAAFYRCRLDATAPVRCTSPWKYSGLPAGAHSFAVQAINDAGQGEFAVFSWAIEP